MTATNGPPPTLPISARSGSDPVIEVLTAEALDADPHAMFRRYRALVAQSGRKLQAVC